MGSVRYSSLFLNLLNDAADLCRSLSEVKPEDDHSCEYGSV